MNKYSFRGLQTFMVLAYGISMASSVFIPGLGIGSFVAISILGGFRKFYRGLNEMAWRSGCKIILAILFPFLIPLLAFDSLLRLLQKASEATVPVIITTFLYAVLVFIPMAVVDDLRLPARVCSETIVPIFGLSLFGGLLMELLCKTVNKFRRSENSLAQSVMEFPAFMSLFLISIFLMAFGGDIGDALDL